jgi:hypothetical protein
MVELHLLILDGQQTLDQDQVRCEVRLIMRYDVEIFAQIVQLAPQERAGIPRLPDRPTVNLKPVPFNLAVMVPSEDRGFVARGNDDRGNALTYVYAEDLADLKIPVRVTQWNNAVMAYMRALPRKTPIILWWR